MRMDTAENAELTLLRRRRALARLAQDGALLAPDRAGRWLCVYPKGDRRRRPLAKLAQSDVVALLAEGALAPAGFAGTWRLSPAGRAAHARAAAPEDPWRMQHSSTMLRLLLDPETTIRPARPAEIAGPFGALVRLVPADFFAAREIAAARRLWDDWAIGQRGLVAGSNWRAPPRGSTRRGPGGAQERAAAAGIDARRRVETALGVLPLSLAGAVQAACFEGAGFEALERQRRWPARSGKLVLKLALELLADHYGLG
jgi:hypothetical protein